MKYTLQFDEIVTLWVFSFIISSLCLFYPHVDRFYPHPEGQVMGVGKLGLLDPCPIRPLDKATYTLP